MTFAEAVLKAKAEIDKSFPKLAQDLLSNFGDAISQRILSGNKTMLPAHRDASPGQLTMNSGRLLRSWMITAKSGAKDRIAKAEITGSKVSVSIQSKVPYARIQNDGGSITPTPKQIRFFWAMYYLSDKKDKFWLAKALKGIKGSPTVIKPTKYFDQAFEEAKKSSKTILEQWIKGIAEKINQ